MRLELRHSRLWIALLVLAAGLATAQDVPAPAASTTPEAAELPALNSLRTPTSPAFTLLGIEPTSVERPNTPADLAVSVLESTNALSSLPKNYALEFSPYWLSHHRKLTWEEDVNRKIGESIQRTFTVSFATAQTGDEAAPVTALAVGARMSLISGHVPAAAQYQLRALQAQIAREAKLFQEQLTIVGLARVEAEQQTRLKAIADELARHAIDEAEAERRREGVRATLVAEQQRLTIEALNSAAYKDHLLHKEIRKSVDTLGSTREGFSWELAGGASWDFPGEDWSRRQARSVGAWTTASYTGRAWSVVGVGRYLEDRAEHTHTFDIGARAIYTQDDYAVSLEYLRRTASAGAGSTQRVVGAAEYRLADKTWLMASFGKSQAAGPKPSLIAKLGLTFNMAKQRFQDPKS